MSEIRPGVVSTIIAVYNRPALLVEAVESVLAQTYRPIEIVIVDDGSTDESGAIARAYADRHPGIVRYLHQPNRYYPSAWNLGLEHITGEFVQILDSDDVLMPDKFARQVAGLREHPDCGISYCYVREYVLGERWSGRPGRRSGETFDTLFPHVLDGKIWPASAPLHRRSVVEANGPFCLARVQPDWEYEARFGARHVRLHHCREYLCDKRGTHHLEGRSKGGVPPELTADYADVLDRILGHARTAGVAPAALDRFARTLFAAARLCAAAGDESNARRCLSSARDIARSPARRAAIAWYTTLSERAGWRVIGARSEWLLGTTPVRAAQWLTYAPVGFVARWRHRARAAAGLVAGRPVRMWPKLIAQGWTDRASRGHVMP